jgi:hypothetical protein
MRNVRQPFVAQDDFRRTGKYVERHSEAEGLRLISTLQPKPHVVGARLLTRMVM